MAVDLSDRLPTVVPEIQTKIQEMVRRIVAHFDPDKIVLFGSYARGTGGFDSDVDLLVIKPVSGSKRAERIAIRRILRGMGIAKDVLLATPDEVARYQEMAGTVIRSALMEGVVLYERTG